MPRIEESVKIKRPVEEVFAFTTEAKSWPRWQATIPEAEQTSPGPVNVGTAFKGVMHMMGGRMKWTAIATVSPVQNWREKRFGFSFWKLEEHRGELP